ncbi:MAG: hydroxymethylbilane synthase [Novosphingobium sp.]
MSNSSPDRPLRLGTRKSPLALAQAEEARARLIAAHGWSETAIELVPVTASGDRFQDRPLAEMGGKALWTKELDAWLMAGEIDFAVHSLKDVETLRPPEIAMAAILPREDVRDVLIGAASVAALPAGARVGTSSPRRGAQLLNLRPDCRIVPFRGNVATRLGKLQAGEADATLLAAAGLNRLGESALGTPLATDTWLPAVGQGAIAIECRADDRATRQFLTGIDCAASRAAVIAERALLAALGGTCHSPIAALAKADSEGLLLRAALLSPDGRACIEDKIHISEGDAGRIYDFAANLLSRAAPDVAMHFTGPHPLP